MASVWGELKRRNVVKVAVAGMGAKSSPSGRRTMPAVAVRCLELLVKYPKTARKLGQI